MLALTLPGFCAQQCIHKQYRCMAGDHQALLSWSCMFGSQGNSTDAARWEHGWNAQGNSVWFVLFLFARQAGVTYKVAGISTGDPSPGLNSADFRAKMAANAQANGQTMTDLSECWVSASCHTQQSACQFIAMQPCYMQNQCMHQCLSWCCLLWVCCGCIMASGNTPMQLLELYIAPPHGAGSPDNGLAW